MVNETRRSLLFPFQRSGPSSRSRVEEKEEEETLLLLSLSRASSESFPVLYYQHLFLLLFLLHRCLSSSPTFPPRSSKSLFFSQWQQPQHFPRGQTSSWDHHHRRVFFSPLRSRRQRWLFLSSKVSTTLNIAILLFYLSSSRSPTMMCSSFSLFPYFS